MGTVVQLSTHSTMVECGKHASIPAFTLVQGGFVAKSVMPMREPEMGGRRYGKHEMPAYRLLTNEWGGKTQPPSNTTVLLIAWTFNTHQQSL